MMVLDQVHSSIHHDWLYVEIVCCYNVIIPDAFVYWYPVGKEPNELGDGNIIPVRNDRQVLLVLVLQGDTR